VIFFKNPTVKMFYRTGKTNIHSLAFKLLITNCILNGGQQQQGVAEVK
jgi:hypothetical protein